jgi:glutamate--cysteine ligase
MYLEPLLKIAESGITAAEEMLAAHQGRWQGNIDPVFSEYAY